MTSSPIDAGVVLITGASAGIGQALARVVAPRARAVVLVARRRERLEDLRAELHHAHPHLRVHVEPGDLADERDRERLLEVLGQAVGGIDVLVNNAGIGDQAMLERADWSRLRRLIEVNVVAPVHLTQQLIGPMVARGRGGVLNIGSGAGFAFIPGNAAYVGSKHFLDGFTESLRAEVADAGVTVTQVAPGPVDSEFDEAAGIEGGIPGSPPALVRISAAQCAREAVAGFDRGDALVFPGGAYRQMMRALPLLPRAAQRRQARATARSLRRGG